MARNLDTTLLTNAPADLDLLSSYLLLTTESSSMFVTMENDCVACKGKAASDPKYGNALAIGIGRMLAIQNGWVLVPSRTLIAEQLTIF